MNVQASPWQDVFVAPRTCKVNGKVVGATPTILTGTGALLTLVAIAYLVFELDKRVPR